VCLLVGMMILPHCRRDGRESREPESRTADTVVVYCSVDENFARPILDRFQRESGLRVVTTFDTEAGKTTGLLQRIMAEAATGRARADVFWSSEVFGTIQLARQGLLEPYASPNAADIPARYKDPQLRWTGTALRGRVLAFRRTADRTDPMPDEWEDVAREPFASKVALANPLFGTTRGHVAAMFSLWGPERGRAFLQAIRDRGGRIVDGNSTAVRAVAAGQVQFAAADTDDVWSAQRAGLEVDCVYPDLGDGGTLFIPFTVSILRGGPNGPAARKIVDYLLSAEVERELAFSVSRNTPVRPALRRELNIELPPESSVSYEAVADTLDTAMQAVREILLR
jgi:iron(III) transport system substrate-binding protein